MPATHLRRNVVAYLALVVALSTGSAYAVTSIANGSVTTKKLAKNAVTSKKIKKAAVRSSDVKDGTIGSADVADGSLLASDLADGVVPGPAAVFTTFLSSGNLEPVATPDADTMQFAFTLPRAGSIELRFFSASFGADCSAGGSIVGLYLDGKPVPHSAHVSYFVANAGGMELLGTAAAGAGAHTASLGQDCATGNWTGSTAQWGGWEVSLLSQ